MKNKKTQKKILFFAFLFAAILVSVLLGCKKCKNPKCPVCNSKEKSKQVSGLKICKHCNFISRVLQKLNTEELFI